MVHCVETVVTM